MGDVRGVGFWENREGGVRQMGEGRVGGGKGTKRVGSGRNYTKKLNILKSIKG